MVVTQERSNMPHFNTSNGGSAPKEAYKQAYNADFNTSNVEVPLQTYAMRSQPQAGFQYIKCGGSAIRNHLFRYILYLFQYIKCGGSARKFFKSFAVCSLFQYIKCGGSAAVIEKNRKRGY